MGLLVRGAESDSGDGERAPESGLTGMGVMLTVRRTVIGSEGIGLSKSLLWAISMFGEGALREAGGMKAGISSEVPEEENTSHSSRVGLPAEEEFGHSGGGVLGLITVISSAESVKGGLRLV